MNDHLEQSQTSNNKPDQDNNSLVFAGLDAFSEGQPPLAQSTNLSAFDGTNPVTIAVPEKPAQNIAGQKIDEAADPGKQLSTYFKALQTAASLPDKDGKKLLSCVGDCLDVIKKSPANHYSADHTLLVKQLNDIVKVAERAYGQNDQRLLPVLQKIAQVSATDPQVPSRIKSKYTISVLEKMLSLQKGTDDRAGTLAQLAYEYHTSNDKTTAMTVVDKMLKESEAAYGKDDPRMIPALSQLAHIFHSMSDYPQSLKFLERVRELQSAPGSKETPDKRIDTLLRLSQLYGYAGKRDEANGRLEEAIALAEKNYPTSDKRYETFLREAASQCGYGLHAQGASLLEKLYELHTTQNRSVEGRLKILQEVSSKYFEADDFVKGGKAYAQIVDIAKNDKALFSFLELPNSVDFFTRRTNDKAGSPEQAKIVEGLYSLGNTLKEAGTILAAADKHNSALKNYQAALNCFERCLHRGIDLKTDKLANILSLAELEIKSEPIAKDENEDQRQRRDENHREREQFGWDIAGLYRKAAELVRKETNNQDPHFLDALDKFSAFYRHQNDDIKALPILTQALALAKTLKRPLPEIGQRTIDLSFAQAATGDRPAAINTCEKLRDNAMAAPGGKPTALLALKHLSKHLEDASWQAAPDVKNNYLTDALKSKERQLLVAKALRLPDADRARIIDEQAQLQLRLEDKQAALASMEAALKLDGNLVQSREFTERMAKIYGENNQLEQMEALLRQSIAANKKNNAFKLPISTCVEFANLATKQGNPAKLKDAAQILEEVSTSTEALLKKGVPEQTYNWLNIELAGALQWLAPYYEEQKDLPKAEKAYSRWDNRAHLISDNDMRVSHRRQALSGLMRIYTAQGLKAAANEKEQELNDL